VDALHLSPGGHGTGQALQAATCPCFRRPLGPTTRPRAGRPKKNVLKCEILTVASFALSRCSFTLFPSTPWLPLASLATPFSRVLSSRCPPSRTTGIWSLPTCLTPLPPWASMPRASLTALARVPCSSMAQACSRLPLAVRTVPASPTGLARASTSSTLKKCKPFIFIV